jgi:hypothetical protein
VRPILTSHAVWPYFLRIEANPVFGVFLDPGMLKFLPMIEPEAIIIFF